MDKRRVHIIGGGTVFNVRPHLAISAPANGTTARRLFDICRSGRFNEMEVKLHLTNMAGGYEDLSTNDDVARLLEKLVADPATKVIFMPVALCDFTAKVLLESGPAPSGKDQPRLQSQWGAQLDLEPAPKLIPTIRKTRKDITLVGFKTTTGASEQGMYLRGLQLLKEASCNLVLANDLHTRMNMIITPEEARYHVSTDRCDVIRNLVDMTWHRSHLTFTRSTVIDGKPLPWSDSLVPEALRTVVDHLVKRGAYKPFRGATVGHFACKIDDNIFLTSIRKTNFNDLERNGLVVVKTDGPDTVLAYGARPSVGGQSQRIIFREHPGTDCIVHAHVPLKSTVRKPVIPVVSQREFECGSHECGANTSRGLREFTLPSGGTLRAVFLANHGPNVVFSKNSDPQEVIAFIEEHFDLDGKTGGPVSEGAR